MDVTWAQVAVKFPEFVQWVVATQGPLPEGPVEEEDYVRFARLYGEAQARA
jgi:hypothetical protein